MDRAVEGRDPVALRRCLTSPSRSFPSNPAPWFNGLAGAHASRRQATESEAENASRPVSRVLYGPGASAGTWRPFIWDARCRAPRATYPNGWAGNRPRVSPRAVPIRSCSRWGLPCRSRCRQRGGLLPHPFTLAAAMPRRSAFCGTFPEVALAGHYPAPYFRGARTFLPRSLSAHAGAAARPAGRRIKAFAPQKASARTPGSGISSRRPCGA